MIFFIELCAWILPNFYTFYYCIFQIEASPNGPAADLMATSMLHSRSSGHSSVTLCLADEKRAGQLIHPINWLCMTTISATQWSLAILNLESLRIFPAPFIKLRLPSHWRRMALWSTSTLPYLGASNFEKVMAVVPITGREIAWCREGRSALHRLHP